MRAHAHEEVYQTLEAIFVNKPRNKTTRKHIKLHLQEKQLNS